MVDAGVVDDGVKDRLVSFTMYQFSLHVKCSGGMKLNALPSGVTSLRLASEPWR